MRSLWFHSVLSEYSQSLAHSLRVSRLLSSQTFQIICCLNISLRPRNPMYSGLVGRVLALTQSRTVSLGSVVLILWDNSKWNQLRSESKAELLSNYNRSRSLLPGLQSVPSAYLLVTGSIRLVSYSTLYSHQRSFPFESMVSISKLIKMVRKSAHHGFPGGQ